MTHWLFKLEVVTYDVQDHRGVYITSVHYYGDKASAKSDLVVWGGVLGFTSASGGVCRGPRHHRGETGVTRLRMGAGRQPPDWYVPMPCLEEGDVDHENWPAGLEGRATVGKSCSRRGRPAMMRSLMEVVVAGD